MAGWRRRWRRAASRRRWGRWPITSPGPDGARTPGARSTTRCAPPRRRARSSPTRRRPSTTRRRWTCSPAMPRRITSAAASCCCASARPRRGRGRGRWREPPSTRPPPWPTSWATPGGWRGRRSGRPARTSSPRGWWTRRWSGCSNGRSNAWARIRRSSGPAGPPRSAAGGSARLRASGCSPACAVPSTTPRRASGWPSSAPRPRRWPSAWGSPRRGRTPTPPGAARCGIPPTCGSAGRCPPRCCAGRPPLYLWQVGVWRAMQALFAGRLREAEQLAAQALAGGAPGEQVTAAQYHAIQLMAIRREQARLGELEGAARQMIAANPARPGWRAALAMLLAENGRSREAHDAFEPLAAEGLERIPRDVDWLTTVILLGEACAELGDVPRARILHEMLLPYREVNVVVGVAVVCLGPAARVLGRLAALAGQPDRARQHFERALAVCGQLGSPLLLAQAQLDYAQALGAELPASRLIDEAQRTAEALGLNKLARQAARLRER